MPVRGEGIGGDQPLDDEDIHRPCSSLCFDGSYSGAGRGVWPQPTACACGLAGNPAQRAGSASHTGQRFTQAGW